MNIGFPSLTPGTKRPELIPLPKDTPGETFHQVLAQASTSSEKLAGAAKQFEALIMGQVLKTARESSDGGWLGTGEDQTGQLALELAEQQFAQALSARGGLGIAKLVTANLGRTPAKAANSGSPPSNLPAPPNTDSTR
jgi:Rod binding domain-containing protein